MSRELQRLLRRVRSADLRSVLQEAVAYGRKIHDSDLEKWARLELHGYDESNPAMTDTDEVPAYRTVPGQWRDAAGRVFLVRDSELEFVNRVRIRPGVSQLGELAEARGLVLLDASGEAQVIRDHLKVQIDYFSFTPLAVRSVLFAIRTQLEDRLSAFEPQPAPPPANTLSNPGDIFVLKPSVWGMGIDLRALWRRFRARSRQW